MEVSDVHPEPAVEHRGNRGGGLLPRRLGDRDGLLEREGEAVGHEVVLLLFDFLGASGSGDRAEVQLEAEHADVLEPGRHRPLLRHGEVQDLQGPQARHAHPAHLAGHRSKRRNCLLRRQGPLRHLLLEHSDRQSDRRHHGPRVRYHDPRLLAEQQFARFRLLGQNC